jgi:hypothetical protein
MVGCVLVPTSCVLRFFIHTYKSARFTASHQRVSRNTAVQMLKKAQRQGAQDIRRRRVKRVFGVEALTAACAGRTPSLAALEHTTARESRQRFPLLHSHITVRRVLCRLIREVGLRHFFCSFSQPLTSINWVRIRGSKKGNSSDDE